MDIRANSQSLKKIWIAVKTSFVSGALALCASSSLALAQDLAPSAMLLERDCDGISWSEPAADTVSLNVHDSAGRYITTLGVNEREYRPNRQDAYFVVETNMGPWQTWLTTDQIFYSPVSINGVPCVTEAIPSAGPLTATTENGFLVWEPNDFLAQARTFRPTVNIHAEDGSYITSVLATDGRWPAPQSGSYYFVAVVGENRNVSDWRTWRRSNVVQVNVAVNADEFTAENYQERLGSSLSRWRAEHHAPFRDALAAAMGQWFSALPDLNSDNGFDWQGITVGELEAQCESGSVAGNVVDIVKTDTFSRFQMEFEFTGCVLNAVTYDGEATVYLEYISFRNNTSTQENMHWRDFAITSTGQFVQRLTGGEQLTVTQTGELLQFRRARNSESYSESTNGVLDIELTSAHFTNFEADPFASPDGPEGADAEVTFREGGTMDATRAGRRQTFNANFALRPDRDVGFHYSTNPSNLQGVPFNQIEVSPSLLHVGLTIVNRDSGDSLQLRPGSAGGDTVRYSLTTQNDTTIIEDDFRYPFACDSRSLFTSLDICDF